METIAVGLAQNEAQSLVNLVKTEARYLCCFHSYAQEYMRKKIILVKQLEDVRGTIDRARGVSHVTSAALQWKREAEELVDVDVDVDLCLNCWRQYRTGRYLAKQTLYIDTLLGRCNFNIADGPTDLPGIKYRCLPKFMDFESRKSTLQYLRKALEDEENHMIGLHGLGGTGKTSMAIQVGAELEGSTFGKVVFLVVSKPPDFKKLRGEIARHLNLELEKGKEVQQDEILNKIISLQTRLLIVLDDVWEDFDLTVELGIPRHDLHNGCTVLITTRKKDICRNMKCHMDVQLDALKDTKEALSLFHQHANYSSTLEHLAHDIVRHCHGVPVVIVAVARSLKDRPPIVWKDALTNLQPGDRILMALDDDLKEVKQGLKLSYDYLKNEKAKKLFLISSLFPEDFEIPVEFLIRIGVGMDPFGEVDDYKKRRTKALDAIMELLDSSLLLNVKMEYVKMHDLVRDVALWIESEQRKEEGLQCLFWKNNHFPKQLDGGNLEILIVLLDPNVGFDLNVSDTLFSEMTKLKVLFLQNQRWFRSPAPSLLQSLHDLRTLNLEGFGLSCISMLEKLLNLETLWLNRCSIIKLPEENFQLDKLRFLRIQDCIIEMSNPLNLIEACPKLEEFTFF